MDDFERKLYGRMAATMDSCQLALSAKTDEMKRAFSQAMRILHGEDPEPTKPNRPKLAVLRGGKR